MSRSGTQFFLPTARRLSCWFALLLCGLSASAERSPPFLDLRAQTLTYPGPDIEFTNLTEVRIGWFGPHESTNGPANEMWWAASLALREANEQGGCHGSPFRLVPCWAVDPWGAGVSRLTRMVYDQQPLAILGSVDSAATHLAEQVVAKANLPLVSPVSTDRSVTLAGVSWAFSCAPSDASIARVLVDHLLTSAANGTDRFALLTTTDHESRMTARAVLRECSRRGRLPAFRFEAQPGTHAIDRQIAATVDARPDVVLIIASSEDSARLTIAVREKLPGVKLFGGQAMGRTGFPELAGKAAEGARFPLLVVDSQADSARAQQFRASFLAECGRPPDYMAALTYDSTRLMLEAIRASGPSRARLRETLSRMSPWQGIAGSIHFDGTGQNTRSDISMAEIKSGVVVPLTGPCALHATASNQP